MVRRVLFDQRQRSKVKDNGDDILAGACTCGSARLCYLQGLRRIHKIRVYPAGTPDGCESLGIWVLDGIDLKSSREADVGNGMLREYTSLRNEYIHGGKWNQTITRRGSLTAAWPWGRAAMQNADDPIIASFSMKLKENDGRNSAKYCCVRNRNAVVVWMIEDLMAILRVMIVEIREG